LSPGDLDEALAEVVTSSLHNGGAFARTLSLRTVLFENAKACL
jgi:hypothetical protein